ncbi:MAG: FAD-dependent oxidoreductase [Caulobacterales bacterium]|nr:FAD-dependent oxidoreductase [Caulobacterales bacterium]
MEFSRRQAIGGLAASGLVSSCGGAPKGWDVIVVGAGVFGAWTAEHMRRAGRRVLLVDAWGPANTRATSGGESRMTRGGYGGDDIYTRMALASLEDWKRLSRDQDLPLFHPTGVLTFYGQEDDYATASYATLRELNIPIERLEPSDLQRRWAQINWSDVAFGLFEPDFGALMARRGVATLVESFLQKGGAYRQATIKTPPPDADLRSINTEDGDVLEAEQFVFACGPWLAKLFPDILADRLFVTRQEIFFFRPGAGDTRFTAPAMPGWADFVGDDIHYGFPDIESRGFKIANDAHGPIVDYDANDRIPSPENLEAIRSYMSARFPGMAGAPLSEVRVCQYENSASGDFLIDRHPNWSNVFLIGMGSGHGFKHGPAVGKQATRLILNDDAAEPRFALATKTTRQDRQVH